ncbi:hypothetical protein IWQ61_008130 [Dispira simplex]|nr:hypothetical protein IWQ61_008130 [Dispira simplex]
MPKSNVRAKARGVTLSGQENPKQYRLESPRLASRRRSGGVACGRIRKRRRSSSASTCPSPGPGPSRGFYRPITNAAEFTEEHMDALHMVPVLNCPIEEVVPVSHCPEDLFHRIRPFWTMSREDLYNYNYEKLGSAIDKATDGSNRPWDLRKAAGIHGCTNAIVSLIDQFTGYESYESDSDWDGEAKSWSKITTRACADTLFGGFLSHLTDLRTRGFPSWDYRTLTWNTQILPEGYNFTVRPDRVIFYTEGRRQRAPFAWVTVNPSYLSPTTDRYESTLPQIAAQTIAMARYQPHEIFGLEFSHHYVTFWRAIIPENYLDLLKDSEDLPPDVFIEMKRSTVLDLEQPEGRRKFSRAFLALLMYWNEQVSTSK